MVLEDKDAYPVTGGFVWIHWLAANITRNEVRDNESQTAGDFIQGCNSWTSIQGNQQSKELSCFYGGMTPPDKEHLYELHIFALDKHALSPGFLAFESKFWAPGAKIRACRPIFKSSKVNLGHQEQKSEPAAQFLRARK